MTSPVDPFTVCGLAPADLTRLEDLVAHSHRDLLRAATAIPGDRWESHPAEGAWSPSEIAQHVLLAEDSLRARVRSLLDLPPDPGWAELIVGVEELLLQRLPAEGKAVAPEALTRFDGLAQVDLADALHGSARKSLALFAAGASSPVKAIIHPHPAFGNLNAFHWMLYIPLHTLRHVRQIDAPIDAQDAPNP